MVIYIDWLLNKINKYRQSLGLSFFFVGLPLVYFLRDGIKLAPGNSAFTAAFTILSLLIAFPINPKRLYHANTIGYLLCCLYGIIALIYLALYVPNRGWFTNTPVEVVNQLVLLTAMFIFAGTSINTLKSTFVQFTLFFSVLGGLSLLYYIARNPAYVIGMRAAISFGDDGGMGSMGNPHIYAKSAYIGVVAGIILLKNETRQLWRWVYYTSVFILLLVIGLCQSMAIVMITGVFFFLYFISNLKAHNIYKSLKWIFGWQGIILFIISVYGIYYIWEYTRYDEYIINVYEKIFERFDKIFVTFFDNDTAQKVKFAGDSSASTRVTNIELVFKTLAKNLDKNNWFRIIFGNGYQDYYVDSPFIEMFHDLGVIGLLLFTALHIVILYWIFKEIFNPTCDFTLMLAYVFLVTLIQNFTFGMPYDYGRWCSMAFVARFALSYKKVLISNDYDTSKSIVPN
ncbi:hypothetical protein [Emticicia sp. SJ17W-69]|uniref:hypothetical protein n=1 Tax=Emticicia sp. SJ17W-69 TaxID=3421657 RepID=UPI003EBAEACD